MSCVIAGDRGIAALRFAGDLSYHQCSIFLLSLGPIRAVGGGERSLCVGSWMGCVAEVAELRASLRHRPVGLALRRIGLWALSCPSAHIRACCHARGASPDHTTNQYVDTLQHRLYTYSDRSGEPENRRTGEPEWRRQSGADANDRESRRNSTPKPDPSRNTRNAPNEAPP